MKIETWKVGKKPNEIKAIVSVPGWAEQFIGGSLATDKVSDPRAAYEYVPLVYRAVRLRCNALVRVPIHFYSDDDEVECPIPQDILDLVWTTEANLLLAGASYWLKRDISPFKLKQYGVQILNPFTMEVMLSDKDKNKKTDLPALVFKQLYNGYVKEFDEESIIFFKDYSPRNDIGPGVPPAGVALANASLLHYLELFASIFFESGAMPITLLGISGALDKDERERVEGFFKRTITGVRNAFKVQAIRTDNIQAINLSQPVKDLAIPELREQARKDVALAFDIPVTMLDDDANYATAREHRASFWEDTIEPRARKIQSKLNSDLFEPYFNCRIKFSFDEMDMFQEDEERRSASYLNYIRAGMRPSTAAQILGIDLPVGVEYQDLDDVESMPVARLGLNVSNEDIAKELSQWARFENSRIGKRGKRSFKPDVIPRSLYGAISSQLESATTKKEIDGIFNDAKKWGAYP